MHNYIINASLQLLPIATVKHPYEWVDEVIAIIKKSKLKCEVGAFSTVIEGKYDEVMKVINDVNEYLYQHHCNEWILSMQVQIRSDADITADEKTDKHK